MISYKHREITCFFTTYPREGVMKSFIIRLVALVLFSGSLFGVFMLGRVAEREFHKGDSDTAHLATQIERIRVLHESAGTLDKFPHAVEVYLKYHTMR